MISGNAEHQEEMLDVEEYLFDPAEIYDIMF